MLTIPYHIHYQLPSTIVVLFFLLFFCCCWVLVTSIKNKKNVCIAFMAYQVQEIKSATLKVCCRQFVRIYNVFHSFSFRNFFFAFYFLFLFSLLVCLRFTTCHYGVWGYIPFEVMFCVFFFFFLPVFLYEMPSFSCNIC